jgi:octaprenyl-diphosphate synthase
MDYVSTPIRDDFEAVNRMVVAKLHSQVPMVESIGHYIVAGGGKRLRPLISLLVARALSYAGSRHIELATAIEFLHTATLLHDDVVDVSAMRRGRATANAQWGNAPSVLVGDFIYTRAFQLLVDIDSMPILRLLSSTTNIIAEGEVEQLARAGDVNTAEADYMRVIEKKTAVLFSAAAEGAVLLAGGSQDTQAAMRRFGLWIGQAFQLIDDVLDYSGDPAVMGKNLGDDLREGKLTLPLIQALSHSEATVKRLIRDAVQSRDAGNLLTIAAALRDCGALAYTRRTAEAFRDRALAELRVLPESACRANLFDIARMAVDRQA